MDIWSVLTHVILSPSLRALAVPLAGKWLAKQLPNVAEDAIADFLIEVGQDLKAQNP